MPTLFDQVTSEANVRLAVELTLHDASKEMFCNPIQIEHCRANQDEYVKLVRDRLLDYHNFETKVGVRSLKRKNAFVFRNFITPAIEDDIARMAVVVPIANALEAKLIDNCFSNRRGEQVKENKSLTEDYAKHAWPKFCEWQAETVKHYNLLLKTDLSSFFDSISHKYLINALMREFDLPANDPLPILLKRMLRVKYVYSGREEPKELTHGISIGPMGNHVFANLLLNEIDHIMSSIPGIAYGRYVDDIRIFGRTIQTIKAALQNLQMRLYEIGLNLNGAKTQFAGNSKALDKLLSEKLFTYFDLDDIIDYMASSQAPKTELVSDLQVYKESKANDLNLPFPTEYPGLDSWKGVRVMSKPSLIKEYLHSINQAFRKEPDKIDQYAVNRLIRIIRDDPNNERHACWLISKTITSSSIPVPKRKQCLRKTLNFLLSRDAPAYAIYRILYFLSYQSKYRFSDFSVVNNSFSGELKKDFAKLIRRCINDSSLMLNLIGLFALKSYNDNHPKEHMRISLQKEQQGNSIWEEHCLLIDKIPEVIQATLEDILKEHLSMEKAVES